MVENLVVSQEVYKHVRCYLYDNLKEYILISICQKFKGDFIYRILAYNLSDKTYAVWKTWNESTQCLNHGDYNLSFNEAMTIFLDVSEIVEMSCAIKSMRMREIAEVAIDRICNNDPELAKEIIIDDLDMTDDELEYFGIDKSLGHELYDDIED